MGVSKLHKEVGRYHGKLDGNKSKLSQQCEMLSMKITSIPAPSKNSISLKSNDGAAPPPPKIEVASPLYVSILLLFSFHLSGNKFLYTFMSVFGGSFAALLITSVIYSKVFIPCILHEQASE